MKLERMSHKYVFPPNVVFKLSLLLKFPFCTNESDSYSSLHTGYPIRSKADYTKDPVLIN